MAKHSVMVSMVVTAVVQLTRAGFTELMKVTGLTLPARSLALDLALGLFMGLPFVGLFVLLSCLQLSSIMEVRSRLGARTLELTVMFMLDVPALLSRPSTSPTSMIRLLSVLKSGVRLARDWERVRREALDTHSLPVCLLNVTDLKVLVSVLVMLCIDLQLVSVVTDCMALVDPDRDSLIYRLPMAPESWPTLLMVGTDVTARLRRVMWLALATIIVSNAATVMGITLIRCNAVPVSDGEAIMVIRLATLDKSCVECRSVLPRSIDLDRKSPTLWCRVLSSGIMAVSWLIKH